MYDMDGLAMYDDGMGNWITPEMLKQHLMAGAAGGAGILLAAKVVSMIPWDSVSEDADTQRYLKLAAAGAVGVLGGRLIFERDRDAAMGFVGGVTGLALAQLVSGFVPADSEFQLPVSFAGAGVSRYDLAALESAVTSSGAAFSPASFQGTSVTERALSAPGVTSEVLAEYAPYLS
jgi:hypothetical protein